MLLLTWHGTLVCLRAGGGGLVHLPLPLLDPDVTALDIDPGARRQDGEKQTHPALGMITVHGAPAGPGISLTRYGRYLCAERTDTLMAFDRAAALPWETFLPLAPQDVEMLTHLVSSRWILGRSREMLRRADLRLLAEFQLQVGIETVRLPDILPWQAPPTANRVSIPAGAGTIDLVQAQPRGSALVQTDEWPVRARRTAETLALAAHRQLAGREPGQEEFEHDVAFLLDRNGAAGLHDLLERKQAATAAPAAPPATAPAAWPAITQPVVSLGASCLVAYMLRRIGLDQPPMPFDWLATTPAMVRHCLETDFSVLLDRSQYRSLTGQAAEGEPENGCAHEYYAREYGIGRVFNHNDPTRDADYRYTQACVDRFGDLLALPGAKLFVLVSPVARSAEEDFTALARLLDERTSSAALLHIAVQPPDPGLAVPLLSAAFRRGAHTLYELHPTSRMDGEGFADAADDDFLARTVAAHAAAPEKVAAAQIAGLRDIALQAERERSLHSVLLGWAMREMAHWHANPVERDIALGRFAEMNAETRWGFVYHFDHGSVRLDEKPPQPAPNHVQQDRALRYLHFFESVAQMLPGDFATSLCMGVGDKVTTTEAVPVFCFQKHTGASTLLLPDIDFLINDFYETPAFEDKTAYDGKTRQAVFAGGTTGGLITPDVARTLSLPRLRAAAYFVGDPDVDFRLPKIVQCTTPEVEAMLREHPFCQADVMPWSEQLRRRFVISIDGNGATCSRVAIALLSNSVLLKYDSPDVLYYFGGLQPWQHFAPVHADRDVAWIMAQETRDPDAFERIALNGRAFARTYLSRSSAQLYTALLLQLYAASFSATPVGALRAAPKRGPNVRRATADTHVVSHVQQRGDMTTRPDGWNGLPGSTLSIEGFALFLGQELAGVTLSYQAVLSNDTVSDPCRPGEFVGSRGDNTPILGLRFSTDQPNAAPVELVYEARFVDGTATGPVLGGTLCQAPSNAPLEAFRLTITKM